MTVVRVIDAFRSEVIKVVSLRSIMYSIAAAIIAPPALAVASGLVFDPASPAVANFPVESHGFETAGFGQPLVILIAALITGTEYLDGQMRTTLLATSRRGRAIVAKLAVVTLLALVIGIVATVAAVILKHAVLGENGLPINEFTAAMGWNVVGVATNYVLMALLASAITILARTVIVTLVVLVPLTLGLTVSLVGAAPILKFLPDLAGLQLLTGYPGIGLLDPVPGGLVMATWSVVLLALASVSFGHRDTGA